MEGVKDVQGGLYVSGARGLHGGGDELIREAARVFGLHREIRCARCWSTRCLPGTVDRRRRVAPAGPVPRGDRPWKRTVVFRSSGTLRRIKVVVVSSCKGRSNNGPVRRG